MRVRRASLSEGFRVNGPTRERGGAPRPQDGAPSPNVDVLAAQVRAELQRLGASLAAIDALELVVARVTEAESRYAQERNAKIGWTKMYQREHAALADARNALERALDCKGAYNGTVSERGGYPALCPACVTVAREVLARLDGSSGDE